MPNLKPLHFIGSSEDDLAEMPEKVQEAFLAALYFARRGEKHPKAKPLQGFDGAGVLEVVKDFRRGTYRAVYTVKLPGAVYVLHVFQKKSKHGIATPRHELDLIASRLRDAKAHYRRGMA